jgi:RNA polymerase sigma-70 factor (ECF subfamily)
MTGGDALPEMPDPVVPQNRSLEDDDAGFVARCRRGETDAFTILVRRHQKKMLNIAYRMMGDYDEACDVVQEAFLAAFLAIGTFRGDARFSTWLCSIVLNHARSHMMRRSLRFRREGESIHNPVKSADGRLRNEPCSPEESVVHVLEKRERDAQVQECIGALDGEQREILILRDIQGFSYEEIGVMLKLPQGTVRSRLFRARNALKDSLLRYSVI